MADVAAAQANAMVRVGFWVETNRSVRHVYMSRMNFQPRYCEDSPSFFGRKTRLKSSAAFSWP